MISGRREERQRIHRLGIVAQFEMKLRPIDSAGVPEPRDRLRTVNRIAFRDKQRLIMRICADPAIGMADQNQIAEAFDLVAGISDHAIGRRHDRRSFARGNVDPVIARAAGLIAEA